MNIEIKPLKCQSCGSGSLDFSIWRVAKCVNCGTVHIIDGKEEISKALQAIGASDDDCSIKIPLIIAVGLYLREQGFSVRAARYNPKTESYGGNWNNRVYDRVRPIEESSNSLIVELPGTAAVYKKTWYGKEVCIESEGEPIMFCTIRFGTGAIPLMGVMGRAHMPDCECVIKLLKQGLHLQVQAVLSHS